MVLYTLSLNLSKYSNELHFITSNTPKKKDSVKIDVSKSTKMFRC